MLFARVLLQDARIILLDEPFNAIDARTTADLLALVARWHAQARAVGAVLHDLDQVRSHFPLTLLMARETIGLAVAGFSLVAMGGGGFLAALLVALLAGWVSRVTAQREDASFAAFDLIALAAGVARVIRQIKAQKARALLVENMSDRRLMDRIAQETGVLVGGTLHADALSPPGTAGDTY